MPPHTVQEQYCGGLAVDVRGDQVPEASERAAKGIEVWNRQQIAVRGPVPFHRKMIELSERRMIEPRMLRRPGIAAARHSGWRARSYGRMGPEDPDNPAVAFSVHSIGLLGDRAR